jgi:nucleoside-diphosphate-sugar epimerase
MDLVVTGGTGFVGGHLIEALVRAGHRVRALARSAEGAALVSRYGAEPVAADLGGLKVEQIAGAEAFLHCAARAEDWGNREQFWSANVEGTRRCLEVARAAGCRRFLHVGTEAAFFNGEPLVRIDEELPYPQLQRFPYSASKAEAERLVLQANAPGFATLSLRPRFVWGPRDRSVLPTLLQMAAQGGFWWVDEGRHLTSSCHVANLVHAMQLALERGEGGRAWFITDGEDQPLRGLLDGLATTAGVQLPRRSLPGWLARAAAWAVEGTWGLLGREDRPPMTRFAIGMLAVEVTVSDRRARQELGYAPVMGVAEGLAQLRQSSELATPTGGGPGLG